MKENIFTKEKLKYILPTAVIFFLLGILFDHFVITKFLNSKEENYEEKQVESQITVDVEQDSIPLEDKKILRDTNTPCSIYVDVSGALKEPGVYCMPKDALIIDAVNKAGGFTNEVAYRFVSRKINLAQKIVENQKIYFPFEKEMDCKILSFLPEAEKVEIIVNNSVGDIGENTTTSSSESNSNNSSGGSSSNTEECININSASLEELDSLTGVGPSTAQKIIDGRPYEKIEDILNVSGIGESSFAKFREKICI
ncbi:MAG: helix-hairpin-helix domain-containing protein [Candidatus Dojkabacteria bacterium]|jgi:competence protein ComEA